MANNQSTRRVLGNINNQVDLPPVGPMPYTMPSDGMVQINPQTPLPAPPPPRYNLTPPPYGAPTFTTTASHEVGPRVSPSGSGPAPVRATPTPQGGTATGFNWYGSHNNMGYMRDASGRVMQIPRALPRRDITGNMTRFGGRTAGSLLGNALVPGAGGLVGSAGGNEVGRRIGNWFNRLWGQRNSVRMPDTLTRDQIRGAGGIGAPDPNDPQIRNQIGGYNLGRGMEGTYLDRTIMTPVQFRAHQRSNQMSRDMANPAVGPAIPDMPGHIRMDDEGDIRHGMTHAELNSPEMRRARDASMVASTRDFMNRSKDANSSALSGPVTRESMIEALMRARGGLPPAGEASGAPMLGTAGPLTYDPANMGPFEPGQEPLSPKTRAQLLLERYQRAGDGR